MKNVIAIALALMSVNSFAASGFIERSIKPPRIVVAKDGSAMAQFNVYSSDFRDRQLFLAPKKLTSIEWRATYYPDNTGEFVEICYYQPGRIEHEPCVEIKSNSSGVIYDFNSYKFDKHAKVMIRHSVSGGRNSGAPAGMDSVVINYSY